MNKDKIEVGDLVYYPCYSKDNGVGLVVAPLTNFWGNAGWKVYFFKIGKTYTMPVEHISKLWGEGETPDE